MQDYARKQQQFRKENLCTEFILHGDGTHEYNTKEENAFFVKTTQK